MRIAKFESPGKLAEFRDFVFGLAGTSTHMEFSQALCDAHTGGKNLAADIQDRALNSSEFEALVRDDEWLTLASENLGIEKSYTKIVFPHFRVDLPDQFKSDSQKMLLPWHQEAAYYLPKGDCTTQSIVLSTILHDAAEKNGALLVAEEAEQDFHEHESRFVDSQKKRFFRVECTPPKSSTVAETKFGETVVFDFLAKHRSGNNTSPLVRLTFLLRASDTRLI